MAGDSGSFLLKLLNTVGITAVMGSGTPILVRGLGIHAVVSRAGEDFC